MGFYRGAAHLDKSPVVPAHRRISGWRSTRATGIGIIAIGCSRGRPLPRGSQRPQGRSPTRGEAVYRIRPESDKQPSVGSPSSDLCLASHLVRRRPGEGGVTACQTCLGSVRSAPLGQKLQRACGRRAGVPDAGGRAAA